MHKTLLVRHTERRCHPLHNPNRPGRIKPTFGREQTFQIRSFHVAHGDEQHALGLAGLEDRDRVRVIQRRSESRLA